MKEHCEAPVRPSALSLPFWEACKRNELVIQRCADCGAAIFYPKYYCAECLSGNLIWEKASGRGTIYTYTVVHSYAPSGFADSVPYVLAIVELEEGVRMMCNVINCREDQVVCGLPVKVLFPAPSGEWVLPQFELAHKE